MLFFIQIQLATQELKANSSETMEAEPVLDVGAENSDKAGRYQQASRLK